MADDTTQQQQETTEEVGTQRSLNTAATPGATSAPAATAAGETKAETLTLTQDALDRIIDERLNRQRAQFKKAQDEDKAKAEALRLAEQGEFKTLADQRAARIAELESELTTRETDALRAKVAARHKLPEHWIGRIQGGTEADMDADAAALAKDMAPPRAPAAESGPSRPVSGQAAVEAASRELRSRYGSF